jgi:hypothetical protein
MVMSRVGVDTQGLPIDEWMKMVDHNHRSISPDYGRNWQRQGALVLSGPFADGCLQNAWMHFLDPDKGLLIAVFTKSVPHEKTKERNTKVYYEISRDEGDTWSPARQIIHPGREYNEEHWMPGVTCGQQDVRADMAPFAKLDDGTIVCGFTCSDPRMFLGAERVLPTVVFLRGRWHSDLTDLSWEIGASIAVPDTVGCGVCEPDLVHLGGQRLFTTLRCQGNEEKGIYSSRQAALSEDGGQTWSQPWPLSYDDGTPVYVPAAFAAFERQPETGRVFWFANILDKPVYGQTPRYPLSMAELDTRSLCLIKDSVTVIQARPEGYPDTARYSNFGHYVDRQTGEFVLLVGEEFWFTGKFKTDYETADYCAHRIRICG